MAEEARAAAVAARDAAARAEAAANAIGPPAGAGASGGSPAADPAERKRETLWAKATAQCVCSVVVFFLLYWGITQLFRVVGILGLSDSPPGLVYADDT